MVSTAPWTLPALAWLLAFGQVAPLPAPPPPPSPTERLASDLVRGLGEPLTDLGPEERLRLVVEVPEPAPETSPERLVAFVADTLEARWRLEGVEATRAAADDRDATHALRVRLRVTPSGGLAAEARLVRLPRSLWERLRRPEGAVLATSAAAVAMGLELRTLLGLGPRRARPGHVRLVALTRAPPALTRAPVLDLVHEDLDGDGVPELAVLHPRHLLLARWVGGSLEVTAEAELLAPPAGRGRVRQPMGRLVPLVGPDGRRRLLVASSDRTGPGLWALEDGWDPVAIRSMPARWPLYATGVDRWLGAPWPDGTDVLEGDAGEVVPAGEGVWAWERRTALAPTWDVRAFDFRAAASPAWDPHVVRARPDGAVEVTSAASDTSVRIPDAGYVAVVGDLDLDGTAELLTTSDAVEGPDRLTLRSLGQARPREVWSDEAPAPVTAATLGDLDADGWSEFLVATWDGAEGTLLVLAPTEP
ncbi:MAG: hypothetical protein ACQEXJ_02390 [Myxococcota bacterium]